MYFYVNIRIYVFLLKVLIKQNLNILSILVAVEQRLITWVPGYSNFFTYLEAWKDLVELNLFSVMTISSNILNSFHKTWNFCFSIKSTLFCIIETIMNIITDYWRMNLKGWKFTLDFQIYECSQIYALKDIWRKSVSQEVFLGNNFMLSDEGMSLLFTKNSSELVFTVTFYPYIFCRNCIHGW